MHPLLLNDVDRDCFATLCRNHDATTLGTRPRGPKEGGEGIDEATFVYNGRGGRIVRDSMTNLATPERLLEYGVVGVDVLVGGMPCQSFSHAGQRKGLDDSRGQLLLEFAELIRLAQPKAFLVENVRGLMTHDGGRTLQSVLGVLSIDGAYTVYHALLNAWDYGVPQKRERIFIVGVLSSGPLCAHKQFAFPAPRAAPRLTLRDVLLPVGRQEKDGGTQYSANKRAILELIPPGGCWVDLPTEELKSAYMGKSYHASGGRRGVLRRLSLDRPAPTLLCNPQAKQSELCHPLEIRPLSVREYARIQSFPDSHAFCGSIANRYKQIGNAVPVNMAYHVGLAIQTCLADVRDRGRVGA